MSTVRFPTDFVWGAASSALQIEGGAAPTERGESIWDDFARRGGAIHNGENCAVACDHYNRMSEDVALMRRIGLRAYRFSISWPRVLPDGVIGSPSSGLDFYDRLVDELLAAQIEPWLTLYHWELPQALQRRGGWLNRDIADWFAQYTARVVARLSDRVSHWMTLNEPQVFISLGLGNGIHAPGLKLSMREQLLATHHALLAHGRAVQTIRASATRKPIIGWAPVCSVEYPASESEADVAAARRATLGISKPTTWNNTWYADPLFFGHYPDDGLKMFAGDAPRVLPGDMETIRQPLDFYGVNIYSGTPVQAEPDGAAKAVAWPSGHGRNALSWPVAPPALRWGPRFMHERYNVPIVVTENGMANLDWVDLDGRVRDPQRIDYTRRYLLELSRAVADGVPVAGYFHWSVMDNFEWAEGYKERFGLIHVDYATQQRTLKDSAYWYRGIIRSNGAALAQPPEVAMSDADEVVAAEITKIDPSPAHADVAARSRRTP